MTNYVVYGLGISGISTAKFLAKNGKNVIATDDNEENLIKKSQDKFLQNVTFLKPEEISFDSETIISFAPGIPLYAPKTHKILDIVQDTKAELACDLEIFYRLNCQKNFIGITGTNGKSTTTALTGFIFKELGISSEIGGNIGVPCFDLPIDTKNFIFETSSYQIDLLSKTHFKIAALTNITPDHLDRHGSLKNYIKVKKQIFKNQLKEDFAIINVDNEITKKIFEELKSDKSFKALIVPISAKTHPENGISLINGKLTSTILDDKIETEIKSKFLPGRHNEENIAFAFAITQCFFIQNNIDFNQERTVAAITKFKGLKHRLQFVGEFEGSNFINDSKATNAESSKNALKAYDNIFWILGGVAKDGGISELIPFFNNIKKAYLIGKSAELFAKTLSENSIDFSICDDLDNAFKKAVSDAKNSGLSQKNILLSPACASFDQWKNFEERGDHFCKLFNELHNSNTSSQNQV